MRQSNFFDGGLDVGPRLAGFRGDGEARIWGFDAPPRTDVAKVIDCAAQAMRDADGESAKGHA